jgi:hypothetical protein
MTKVEYQPEFPWFLFHTFSIAVNIVDHFVRIYSVLTPPLDEAVSCSDGKQ